MKRTAFAILIFLLVFVIPSGVASAITWGDLLGGREPLPNVILISWDGVQRDHLKECLSRGEVENISRLIGEGCITEIEVDCYPHTKSGHALMLTGYDPSLTGVYNNFNYGPIPGNFTILERAKERFGGDGILVGMVTSKPHHLGSSGPGNRTEVDGGRGERANEAAEPFYFTRGNLDIWDGDTFRLGDETGPLAVQYLNETSGRRFFFFFHFGDPDYFGHYYGENSQEYTDGIITCDIWLGAIMEKLRERGVMNQTGIFVTTDHGFNEGTYWHEWGYRAFLATNTYKNLNPGRLSDIAPTILEYIRIDPGQYTPPLTGTSLTRERPSWQPLPSPPGTQYQIPPEEARIFITNILIRYPIGYSGPDETGRVGRRQPLSGDSSFS